MDLQALRSKKAESIKAAKDLRDKARAAGRDLSDQEMKDIDAHIGDAETASVSIAQFEARAATLEKLDGMASSLAQSAGRRVQPETITANTSEGVRLEVTDRWREDPQKGFKSTRAFFGAVLNADTGRSHKNSTEQNAALKTLFAAAGADEQAGYADPYGGYLVPEGFLPSMLQLATEADPTAGRTQNIPMASPRVELPARVDKNHTSSVSGGLRVYRRAEADTVSSSRQEYERVALTANGLLGLSYATEEILSDSPISLAALLEAGFRQEFAAKLLNEKLYGTGVGEFEGVMTTPGLVSISKETGQAANTINTQNILKMRARCYGYGNAVWLANHDTFPQLMQLTLAVGTGGSAVAMMNIRESGIETLLGRPIFYTEFCKTLGTTGDLILGDWSQYLEGTYQPLQSAESVHVRFVNHERTFKFWMRNDGRCWWRSALTVRQGSNSLSPFVALATRA